MIKPEATVTPPITRHVPRCVGHGTQVMRLVRVRVGTRATHCVYVDRTRRHMILGLSAYGAFATHLSIPIRHAQEDEEGHAAIKNIFAHPG